MGRKLKHVIALLGLLWLAALSISELGHRTRAPWTLPPLGGDSAKWSPGGIGTSTSSPYSLFAPSDLADIGRDDRFGSLHGFPRPRGGSTADSGGWADDVSSPTRPGSAGTIPGESASPFATGGIPITIPNLHDQLRDENAQLERMQHETAQP